MLLPSRQPPKLNPRADFKPEEFRKLIFSQGLRVRWELSSACPCSAPASASGFSATLSASSAAPTRNRPDCPACNGRGYLYHSAQEIRALITGARRTDERFSQVGGSEYADGLIGLSLLPEHLPAMGDRFTLLDAELLHREVITRGATDTDALTYPVAQRTHDLAGGAVTFGVRYARSANTAGEVSGGRAYAEGADFDASTGALVWTAPDAPPEGARVAVEYYTAPAYIVQGQPHAIRDAYRAFKAPAPYHISLPIYAEARLEQYGAPREGGGL